MMYDADLETPHWLAMINDDCLFLLFLGPTEREHAFRTRFSREIITWGVSGNWSDVLVDLPLILQGKVAIPSHNGFNHLLGVRHSDRPQKTTMQCSQQMDCVLPSLPVILKLRIQGSSQPRAPEGKSRREYKVTSKNKPKVWLEWLEDFEWLGVSSCDHGLSFPCYFQNPNSFYPWYKSTNPNVPAVSVFQKICFFPSTNSRSSLGGEELCVLQWGKWYEKARFRGSFPR